VEVGGCRPSLAVPETEEGRAGPAGTGNLPRDDGQAPVGPVPVQEASCRHRHTVGVPLPVPQQPGPRLDPNGGLGRGDGSSLAQVFGKALQALPERPVRSSGGDLLQPVGDDPAQEGTTHAFGGWATE
jgi:hypothetical protein